MRLVSFLMIVALVIHACKHEPVKPKPNDNNNNNDTCNVSNVGFAAVVHPILLQNCQSCHSDQFATEDVSVSDYSDVKKIAEDGDLLEVLKKGTMPPAGALPACEIQKIEKWVQNGAPNN